MCLCHKVTATTVTSLLKLKDDSLCFSKHHGTELIDQGCTLGSVKFTVPESWRTGKWLLWQTYLDFGMGMCFLTRWVCVWVCGLPRSPPVSALLFSTPATMFQRHSVSCFFNIMNKKCSSWGGSLPPNFLTLHFLSTLSLTWAKLVFSHHCQWLFRLCWWKHNSPSRPTTSVWLWSLWSEPCHPEWLHSL